MDFLTMVVVYVIVFSLSSYILMSADSKTPGIVGNTRRQLISLFDGLYYLLPNRLRTQIQRFVHHTFNERNCYLQVTYCLIVAACFWVFIYQIIPHAEAYSNSTLFTYAPFIELLLNLYFFFATSLQDPGTITTSNVNRVINKYAYDGRMYFPQAVCRTCSFVKPARSKHCSICNRCVVRFDHHCSWVNNCIGAYNIHLFIGYLFTIAVMCVHVAILGIYSLLDIVYSTGLHNAQYVDGEGQLRPIDFRVLIQHLFLEYPLMVFLTTTLALLSFLISGFTIYHLFLVATNQTTNERYKRAALQTNGSSMNGQGQTSKTNHKNKKLKVRHSSSGHRSRVKSANNFNKTIECDNHFYNNGFGRNIKEILFPSK